LVRRKLVESRTEAKRAIEAGLVRVGSNASPKAATMVSPDEPLHVIGPPEPFVSRAGRKLDAALTSFEVDVAGLRAIDVGASTGGFTDCLLQRGADSVCAVDVGYGQMHWRIRQDERVDVVERTNIRIADPTAFGDPFDIVVSDLSFISLRTVSEQLAMLGTDDATWVLLIKPQFEAGRDGVGKGGIVRDTRVRRAVIGSVLAAFEDVGLGCNGIIESPITGATGNVEYVAMFSRGHDTVRSGTVSELFDGKPQ
jgi:23S rRNA (cytidine1920-2'-O)/16S rRNA (cytidine1409-2'-O)-methyltransferase